jgi:hypothetical protein
MDGGDQREALLGDVEHAVPERLVVVDDVEVAPTTLHQARDALRERLGLGKACRPHRQDFLDIDEVAELLRLRRTERVGLAVEVQGRHLGQGDTLVQLRVRLAREDLDGVAERHQLTAEMADVDALTATVWLAAVGHECDAQGAAFEGRVERALIFHRCCRDRTSGWP